MALTLVQISSAGCREIPEFWGTKIHMARTQPGVENIGQRLIMQCREVIMQCQEGNNEMERRDFNGREA